MGPGPEGSLFVKIGRERATTSEENAEREKVVGRKLLGGKTVDYLLAQYDPEFGSIRDIAPLLTPFF